MSATWPWTENTRELMVQVLGSVDLDPTDLEVARLLAYVPEKKNPVAQITASQLAIRRELEAYTRAQGSLE